MTEQILDFARGLAASPWIYLVVLTLAWLDGFLPVFPSESVVITAGVFAAAGAPDPLPLVVVAAAGAFVGDHTSYLIGRFGGERILGRSPRGTRRRAVLDRMAAALTVRGGLVLVVARYIPGGRTAATVTMGMLGYPVRRFTPFAALAAATWGCYGVLIGYFGGLAFENDPLRGLAVGIGLAVSVTVVVELVRYVRARRTRRADTDSTASQSRPNGVGAGAARGHGG